jgi:hypothetical protein
VARVRERKRRHGGAVADIFLCTYVDGIGISVGGLGSVWTDYHYQFN